MDEHQQMVANFNALKSARDTFVAQHNARGSAGAYNFDLVADILLNLDAAIEDLGNAVTADQA